MDIKQTENFDFALDHRRDMPVVSGREEFEQTLEEVLITYFSEIIGTGPDESVYKLLEVNARRVAKDMDELEKIASIAATQNESQTNVIDVTIIYKTGDTVSFNIS